MSKWNHAICDSCWPSFNVRHMNLDEPYRVIARPDEVCCYCGEATNSGIYVREDPTLVPCNGQGEVHT